MSLICIANGFNLDRSDPQSIAYEKALTQKLIKDFSDSVTIASMITPVGSAAKPLQVAGIMLLLLLEERLLIIIQERSVMKNKSYFIINLLCGIIYFFVVFF